MKRMGNKSTYPHKITFPFPFVPLTIVAFLFIFANPSSPFVMFAITDTYIIKKLVKNKRIETKYSFW